jgi:hypothetical protein
MEQRFGRTPSPWASSFADAQKRLSASPFEKLVGNLGEIVDFGALFGGTPHFALRYQRRKLLAGLAMAIHEKW